MLCSVCLRRPIWLFFNYCLHCFADILLYSRPVKHYLRGRYAYFICNTNYWGVTDQTSVDSIVKTNSYIGQVILWEFWDPLARSVVQVVTYLRAKSVHDYNWYIVMRKNILYVTKNYRAGDVAKCPSFFGYKSCMAYIQKQHLREAHSHDVSCHCKPLSKFSTLYNYTAVYRPWSLAELSAFSLRSNLYYLNMSVFITLPPRLVNNVAEFDAIKRQTGCSL
jgi:hypothetical protein